MKFRGNYLSKLLFLWMEPFIFRWYKRKVQLQDIPDLPNNMQVGRLKEDFEKAWNTKKNPSLFRTIISLNRYDIFLSGICVIVTNLCELCAIVMGWLILEIAINPDQNDDSIQGIIYCCVFTIVSGLGAIVNGNYVYIGHLLDVKMFTQCVIVLFQKSLSLPQDLINDISIGRIMNMVANDLRNLEYKSYKIQYLWGFPLTFISSLLLLYLIVGPIALAGLGVICFNIVLMFAAAPLLGKIKSRNLAYADKRVKFINQVIRNMRIVKMFGWENVTQNYVKRIRRKEWMYGMSYTLLSSGAYMLFYLIATPLAVYVTFLVSYLTDLPIEFGKAILCFMLYQQIQLTTAQFIMCIDASVLVYTSGSRISKFLNLKAKMKRQDTIIPSFTINKFCIKIRELRVEWPNQQCKGLDNINLNVTNEPQLVFVTGSVGAGKSTLLLTLCNEISQYKGSVHVNGRVVYAAQESWVFSGTIRANILVGGEFDYDRYWKVITVCGLIPDLELFGGERDLTLVGERGITLSGGQKSRVSLARTVYTIADIYLLDEPLGAVDSHVSNHIFEECIQGFLKDKVVILATHQTRFARENDRMLRLENGRIILDEEYKKTKCEKGKKYASNTLDNETNQFEAYTVDYGVGIDLDCLNGEEIEDTKPLSTPLSEEKSDRVRFSIYPKYFKVGGICLTLLLLLFTAISNIAQISFIWWIQKFMWLAYEAKSYDNTNNLAFSNNFTNHTGAIGPEWFVKIISKDHFWIITALITGSIFFLFQEWFIFVLLTWRVAIKLHSKMFKSIMNTSMRFFEINPSGRILNRFSKDMGYIDLNIPYNFLDFWVVLFIIIFTLIASCFVQKLLILPAILLIFLFFASVHYYLPTATELRSLESLLQSPLYSHISLTLQGMTTVRSHGMETKVISDLLYHLNSYTKVWGTLQSSVAWFVQRISFIIRTFLSIVIWTAFVGNYYYGASANISLSFQIILNIPTLFFLGSIQAVNLDIMMVSVERVLSYIKQKPEIDNKRKKSLNKMPKIEPRTISTSRGMMSTGNITFENVYLKYADDLPMVLKGISFKVEAGSKVGIVGRTGAGKSSIITALFRLTNISGGRILIDGVDISYINLHRLRTQISVIPQDPMLFTGTLRFNLDPSDQFSDSEIWSSLEHVQLRGLIASLQGGLFASVQEDGNNFSVGEKQLLCLARALLKSTRILLIDEATANVDHLTDAKIQNTLRKSFNNQSVISIAHRLDTVIDYDRIVVMEKGEIVEADSPYLLLLDSNSYFSKLVSQTDPVTQMALKRSAHTAYNSTSDQI